MHDHHVYAAEHDLLVGLGSITWIFDAVMRSAPPWSMVPPILIAIAALVRACDGLVRAWRDRPSPPRTPHPTVTAPEPRP